MADLLSAANVIFALLLAWYAWRMKVSDPTWIAFKHAMTVTGLYVAVLYTYVLGVNFDFWAQLDPVWFGRVFVRPLMTLVLGLLLALVIALGRLVNRLTKENPHA